MFWNSKYSCHWQLQIKKQLNHTFLTVSAKLCWVYCLLFRILFKDFFDFRFSANLSLKKKFLPLPTERERVGRVGENPGNEVVHPNPWKFWNFFTCHYIFPLRIAGLIFVVSEPIQGFVQRPLDSDSGWQELFFLYESFLFSVGFARVLQSLLSRYIPENLQDIYCFICSYSSG